MTQDELHKMPGADLLRLIVENMNTTNEWANDDRSVAELINIGLAHLLGEWDKYPDEWTPEQREAAALYREPPRFDRNERPLPPLKRRRGKVIDPQPQPKKVAAND